MGTWTLWIAFNAGVALLLLLDLGLFHRHAHTISVREAAFESAVWVALSGAFGFWIFLAQGRGPGLEFFTGYLIEKSLSVDNVFVFLLIFRYFRVDSRYQHRLLFWGVLSAFAMRGVMIGAGVILIERFAWILYLFGAFLLYAGLQLFHAEHAVHPEKNPILRWARKILPMTRQDAGQRLFARENGRRMATPLLLVLIVLETTDLVLAADSIPAVFGVTRDPFLVYTSNVCAILGLRSLYFLLAGILPYLRYLDDGLAITLMFIGAKMLVDPWIHISTGLSLAVVGSIILAAIVISIIRTRKDDTISEPILSDNSGRGQLSEPMDRSTVPQAMAEHINRLAAPDSGLRAQAALDIFRYGTGRRFDFFEGWEKDEELRLLVVREQFSRPDGGKVSFPKLTVGIAVQPVTFEKIRAANGSPTLADVPPDQDAIEFGLEFTGSFTPPPRLDVLTTKAPGGGGAISRFLEKFGEGIQQVEVDVTDVDRATGILRARFQLAPVYPTTRPGANGTRVNFFLATASNGKKVLAELVEQPKSAAHISP